MQRKAEIWTHPKFVNWWCCDLFISQGECANGDVAWFRVVSREGLPGTIRAEVNDWLEKGICP